MKNEMKLVLNQQDQDKISDAVKRISLAPRRERGIEGIIDAWDSFVESVEKGYNLTIYDYDNELTIRNFLERTIETLSEDGQQQFQRILGPVDQRFRDATETIEHSLGGPVFAGSYWWWFRIPRDLRDRLKKGLIAEGLI